MTKEDYKSLVLKLDDFLSECRSKISDDEYPFEKNQLYIAIRHVSHWLGDIENLDHWKSNAVVKLGVQSAEQSKS